MWRKFNHRIFFKFEFPINKPEDILHKKRKTENWFSRAMYRSCILVRVHASQEARPSLVPLITNRLGPPPYRWSSPNECPSEDREKKHTIMPRIQDRKRERERGGVRGGTSGTRRDGGGRRQKEGRGKGTAATACLSFNYRLNAWRRLRNSLQSNYRRARCE